MHPESAARPLSPKPWCLVGHSSEIRNVAQQVEKAAQSRSGVLVIEEADTGRGVVARAIHAEALRPVAAFVPILL